MDILAHMLWTNYGTRVGNRELNKKNKPLINLAWATFWGVFPDLFAFGIPIALLVLKGIMTWSFTFNRSDMLDLPAILYQYSHSLVIWAVVFLFMWIISKRPKLVLLGWAFHILIDIPSHAGRFYPTPFLFPISNYRYLYGVSWSNTWYIIINYSLLLIASLYFFGAFKKKKV